MKPSVTAAVLLALSTGVSTSAQSLLQHRHSFVPTVPVEPTDENLKVARHQVQIVGLSGFHEWEVRGPLEGFAKAAGKVFSTTENLNLADWIPKNAGKVHVQWYGRKSPLIRPPFTPTFIPGYHLAVSSNDFSRTWNDYCPMLADFVGAVDCQENKEDQPLESQGSTKINARHLIPIHEHRYIHRDTEPINFLPPSSVVTSLISKQQSGSSTEPALIDLVLQNGNAVLKVLWPLTDKDQSGKENVVTVAFDEKTDKVVEIGWLFREITEQQHTVYDHYLGATVKMDANGEEVNEALLQTRSPVFPPHKVNVSTGEVQIPGHGYSSTMSPPQTLHPHSVTTIQSNPYIADTTIDCDLHVLQVLPPGIFVDPFQLQSLAPDIGQAVVFGETDLEKPVGVVAGWGSLVMVKVQPEDSEMASRWMDQGSTQTKTSRYTSTVDIPMHMRYQPPVPEDDPATHVRVAVPWPIVAWACPAAVGESSTAATAKKLFHIPALPLSLLFPKEGDEGAVDFRFVLPDPIPRQFPENHVSVPVGRLQDLALVRTATFALAGAGTVAVTLALIKAVLSRGSGKGKQD